MIEKPKIILGVDPGFVAAGYAVLEKNHLQKIRLLELGSFNQKSSLGITPRIGAFYDFFRAKVDSCSASHLALETPFLGKSAQNFMKLGYLRGVLNLISFQQKINLLEYAPREAKAAVTGYGNADKDQVSKALGVIFPEIKNLNLTKLDATDALGIAFCAAMRI